MRILRTSLAALAATVALAACAAKDLTDPPNWDLSLNIPAKGTTISVGSLLPSGVAIKADSSAFTVNVNGATISQSLAASCGACVALNGQTAPRPAFSFTQASNTALPSEVTTATLAGGTLAISIQNGFGFDPLGGSAAGTLILTVTDANNRQLAKDSLNGATFAIPAFTTVNRSLTLATGSLKGPLTVTAAVNSPAGAAVAINTSQNIVVTGTPQNISVSDATVSVSNKNVNSNSSFDLSGIDSAISDRFLGGTMQLTVVNPFGATGNLTVNLTGGGVNITKALALASGTSNPTISFTQAELKSMAGKNLNLAITGPVSAAAAVKVVPRDKVTVDTRLLVTLSTEAK